MSAEIAYWIVVAIAVGAVITACYGLYAHFSGTRWIRVCSYCGKEHCTVAHRWKYRPRQR